MKIGFCFLLWLLEGVLLRDFFLQAYTVIWNTESWVDTPLWFGWLLSFLNSLWTTPLTIAILVIAFIELKKLVVLDTSKKVKDNTTQIW